MKVDINISPHYHINSVHENVAQALTSIKLQLDTKVTATLNSDRITSLNKSFFQSTACVYIFNSEKRGSAINSSAE